MGEIYNDDEVENKVSDFCTFKFYKKRNRTPAFVTEFMNGRVVSDSANGLQFESFKSADNTRCLSATNGRINYTGVSTSYNDVPLQYFVGVRDKKTGKMKLYDACSFRMRPKFNTTKSNSDINAPTTPKNYRESLNELTSNFGSKTKKRALSSILKHAVDDSGDIAMPIQDIVSANATPEIATTPADNMDYLPTLNRGATNVYDVFDISSIISPQEDDALDVEVASLSGDELANKKSTFNKFVSARFEGGNLSITKTKYLIYYNYLVQFQQLGYSDMRKKNPAPNIPEPFKSKFLKNFTVESVSGNNRIVRSTPPNFKDKLVAHILVLALIIDDFTIDLADVGNDLKSYGLPRLATISQALGCHIGVRAGKEGVKTKIAVLKLPLYVMTLKNAKMKRSN